MMRLEYQILSAVVLDLALGDPRWLPHPVRGIGCLATWLERLVRRGDREIEASTPDELKPEAQARNVRGGCERCGDGTDVRSDHSVAPRDSLPDSSLARRASTQVAAQRVDVRLRLAGLVVALTVYGLTGLAAWGAIRLAALVHPIGADLVSIVIIYTAIAPRDLARHSMAVFRALTAGDLVEARRRVAMIVGRDTDRLDEPEVVRAAVESVAESTVDGVTAPLVFAVVAGPVGAIVYRAINTLDSMFGHRDARYRDFGWAAARIDDLANWLPARLTAPLVCLAALIAWQRPCRALRVLVRDGRRHESPNAGLSEAAMAGALGV